jgi:hypothetical protein
MTTNLADWLSHGAQTIDEHRPDSATSSVLSRDSGVARSDPKSSRDFSAKSESSSRGSLNHNNSNTLVSKFGRHGLLSLTSSNTIQRLVQQRQHQCPTPATNESINEQIRDKLQPLNTQRLKMLRQATKSFIVSSYRYVHTHTHTSYTISHVLDEYHGQW